MKVDEIAEPVKRCSSLEEFHKELTDPCPRPCVFKVEKDYEISNWLTEEYIRKHFGDNEVAYHESDTPEFFILTKHSILKLLTTRLSHSTTLSKFIDLILGRKNIDDDGTPEIANRYFSINGTHQNIHKANKGVVETWSTLFDDTKDTFARYIPLPPGAPEDKSSLDLDVIQDVGVWVSAGRNQKFTMHWDTNGHHNINFQCQGTKRFILYSPNDTDFLYPGPGPLWQTSRISDPYDIEGHVGDYPLFEKARPYVVDIHPNEILFIPARWWHHVTHTAPHELTVNLTAWFKSPVSAVQFSYASFFVHRPWQAYALMLKGVAAMVGLILYLLFVYDEDGGHQIADTEKRMLRRMEPLPTIIRMVKLIFYPKNKTTDFELKKTK